MIRIELKPFSLNKCWFGMKKPTPEFKQYRLDVEDLLPEDYEVPEGELFIFFRWGQSSRGADIDNSCKPFLDCLQNKYGFNDNKVYLLVMEKVIVPKKEEFIEFDIRPLSDMRVEVLDLVSNEVIYE